MHITLKKNHKHNTLFSAINNNFACIFIDSSVEYS